MIWFGVGRTSAVSLVTFYVVVILYVSAQRAALNLDPIYENYALTLGAVAAQMLRDILDPGNVRRRSLAASASRSPAPGDSRRSRNCSAHRSGIGKVLEVLAGATDPQGILATLLVLGFGGDPRRCGSRHF